MSALHPTRRRLLSGIGTGLAGVLTGCAGESTSSTTNEKEVHGSFAEPPSEAILDFEVQSLRVPTPEPFVSVATQRGTPTPRPRGRQLIHENEQATALQFDTEHDDIDAVRSFVETTNYEHASVIVYQRSIDACYERRVEYVTVEPDRYFIQFCRQLRGATTPCEPSKTEMDAQFIRIPQAYDTPPSSQGGGESSGCRRELWMEADHV